MLSYLLSFEVFALVCLSLSLLVPVLVILAGMVMVSFNISPWICFSYEVVVFVLGLVFLYLAGGLV